METSREKAYTEMFNTLTDYNDHNNTPLSNANILESIRKVIEEESIVDANNVTTDTFSHASNSKREDAHAIFTSENLDKFTELIDTVNNLTINTTKYYESNKATTSDAHGDI